MITGTQNTTEGHTILDLPKVNNLDSLIQGYVFNCRSEGKSPTTIDTYSRLPSLFTWYCQSSGFPDNPQALSPTHIRNFLWYIGTESNRWGDNTTSSRHPASNATVNHYYRVLCRFFGWLVEETIITDNPIHHLKPPKVERNIVQALTSKEIDALFHQCSGKTWMDIRDRAILSVFLDCGLRVSELAGLLVDDLDLDTGSLLVRKGKGSKQRIVHIGAKAQKTLWRYITLHRRSDSNHLFINRAGAPLGLVGVKALINRLGRKVGVKAYPHKLRHTFAISFLRAGGDVFSLQYLLGHSTLQMTQRYLQSLNANDAANAHKKFSPLDNLGKW